MDDADFDDIMTDCLTEECRSAPLLQPTDEMRRMVTAKRVGRRRSYSRPGTRWIPFGAVAAAAAAVMLIVLTPGLNPFSSSGGTTQGTIALREWSADGVEFTGVRPGGGRGGAPPKGSDEIIQQLVYQYHNQGTASVVGLDLSEPSPTQIHLAPNAEYRLAILPAVDLDLMVLQVRPDWEIANLLQDSDESRISLRLSSRELHFVPSVSAWFYLTEQVGEERILIVASTEPMQQLEKACRAYFIAERGAARADLGQQLLEQIESIKDRDPTSGGVWEFSFN